MPAVSKNQSIAMILAKKIQQGEMAPKPGTPSAEIASSMKPSDVTDFASSPQKGLPTRVPQAKNVGGAGPGRPPMKVKNVGRPVKKMKF